MREKLTEKFKNYNTGGENRKRNNEAILSEKGEFKEITGKWNQKNNYHNSDNGDEQAGTKFVEWTANPIDENEVNDESNKDGGGGEFVMREIIETGNDSENNHTKGDSETDRDRIGEDVGDKTIFDAVGVSL